MAAEMQEAELEMLFHKAAKVNCGILDQLRTFMLRDLVCEELSSFSQQACAKAEVSVSPQTCSFVCANELNYVSAASALAAKVAGILHCAFESKNGNVKCENTTVK